APPAPWLRSPAPPRISSATAAAYLRAGRPFDAMHLLEASDKAAREARAKLGSKAEAPAVDPLAAMKANVLLAMGRRKDAIPWMVEASAAPRGTAFALRGQLLEWADTDDVGPPVVAAAQRPADAAPKDAHLALWSRPRSRAGRGRSRRPWRAARAPSRRACRTASSRMLWPSAWRWTRRARPWPRPCGSRSRAAPTTPTFAPTRCAGS